MISVSRNQWLSTWETPPERDVRNFPGVCEPEKKKTEIPLIIFVIRLKRPWSDNEKFGNNVAIS